MDLKTFLEAIPRTVTSGLGLVAFIGVLIVWGILGFRTQRMGVLLKSIGQVPPKDRKALLETEMNTRLPDNMPAEVWLRAQRGRYLLTGFISLLVFAAIVAALILSTPVASSWITPFLPPTPLAFAPAQDNETLILVGSFADLSGGGGHGVAVMQRTYDQLVELSEQNNIPGVKIRHLETPIITSDDEARALGNIYRARLVIWGYSDTTGAKIRGTRTDTQTNLQVVKGGEIDLQNPTTVPICLSREVPAQGTYIAFLSLGQAIIQWDNLQRMQLARQFVDDAIDGIEQRPMDVQCSKFNPWSGYAVRGHIYGTIAMFYQEENKLDDAIEWRKMAILAYNRSIDMNPNESWVKASRGVSQAVLAEVLSKKGQSELAIEMYQASVESYNAAIELDSDVSSNYRGRAGSMSRIGYLLDYSGRDDDAITAYRAAIADYSMAVKIDPGNTLAVMDRGLIRDRAAGILVKKAQLEAAIAMYTASIADLDAFIKSEPNNANIIGVKAIIQQRAGAVMVSRNDRMAATEMYRAAIDTYNTVLALTPDVSTLHWGKGQTQAELAALLAEGGERNASIELYRLAIDSHDAALKLDPSNASVLWSNAFTKGRSAAVLAENGQRDAAIERYRAALASYDAAAKLDPSNSSLPAQRAQYQQALDTLLAQTK